MAKISYPCVLMQRATIIIIIIIIIITITIITCLPLLCSCPHSMGIKRLCASDVWLPCIYIGAIRPMSRTERPRKTKTGTEVVNVTRDLDTTFKVRRSKINLQGSEHIVAASRTACLFQNHSANLVTEYTVFAFYLFWSCLLPYACEILAELRPTSGEQVSISYCVPQLWSYGGRTWNVWLPVENCLDACDPFPGEISDFIDMQRISEKYCKQGRRSWPHWTLCKRDKSMFWPPPPQKVTFFHQNCCWITLQVSHHEGWKTDMNNGR